MLCNPFIAVAPTGYPPIRESSTGVTAHFGKPKILLTKPDSIFGAFADKVLNDIKLDKIINGNREGISTCKQRNTPFVAPFLHSFGKISSVASDNNTAIHKRTIFHLFINLYTFIVLTD